jgi:hypothetical protein
VEFRLVESALLIALFEYCRCWFCDEDWISWEEFKMSISGWFRWELPRCEPMNCTAAVELTAFE